MNGDHVCDMDSDISNSLESNMKYQPPYTITPSIVNLVAAISEKIGRYTVLAEQRLTPHLRRENRIRTIHASLAIENNTLTLEQVTAVIEGKRVLGHPREIQEVRNAFAAYEALEDWHADSERDLLLAHEVLMRGLMDEAGCYRSGGVGIFQGKQLVHMAPPANRVPQLMADLLRWLAMTTEHPLIAGCVFHYEFEFIHPFADGNGRMGRLWQTLILRDWNAVLAYMPVETVIREHQESYYQALATADERADATPFVEYMLSKLLAALREAVDIHQTTDQVSDQVTGQVAKLIQAIGSGELSSNELMQALGFVHRPAFRGNYLNPALAGSWIERTQPDSPRSPTQRYRLTPKGWQWLQQQTG